MPSLSGRIIGRLKRNTKVTILGKGSVIQTIGSKTAVWLRIKSGGKEGHWFIDGNFKFLPVDWQTKDNKYYRISLEIYAAHLYGETEVWVPADKVEYIENAAIFTKAQAEPVVSKVEEFIFDEVAKKFPGEVNYSGSVIKEVQLIIGSEKKFYSAFIKLGLTKGPYQRAGLLTAASWLYEERADGSIQKLTDFPSGAVLGYLEYGLVGRIEKEKPIIDIDGDSRFEVFTYEFGMCDMNTNLFSFDGQKFTLVLLTVEYPIIKDNVLILKDGNAIWKGEGIDDSITFPDGSVRIQYAKGKLTQIKPPKKKSN